MSLGVKVPVGAVSPDQGSSDSVEGVESSVADGYSYDFIWFGVC